MYEPHSDRSGETVARRTVDHQLCAAWTRLFLLPLARSYAHWLLRHSQLSTPPESLKAVTCSRGKKSKVIEAKQFFGARLAQMAGLSLLNRIHLLPQRFRYGPFSCKQLAETLEHDRLCWDERTTPWTRESEERVRAPTAEGTCATSRRVQATAHARFGPQRSEEQNVGRPAMLRTLHGDVVTARSRSRLVKSG